MYKIGDTTAGNILIEMTPREWEAVANLFRIELGFTVDFGGELIRYRLSKGLTQQAVADTLGISKSYVSLIERGLAENISMPVRQRIIDLVHQK